MMALPVEQYPEIVPPEVVVAASYPGANAETLAETVAAPIEQQVNGVEDMIYMRSTSSDAGSMRISVYSEIGTNPDQATIKIGRTACRERGWQHVDTRVDRAQLKKK